jgi:hypothetical protein
VGTQLDMHISDFSKHFVTTEEEKWIDFINEQKKIMNHIESEQQK